ncbi:hypothetical protein Agub_g10547 [Astrephomene gubernaculifera]|uniref:Mitochondrial inner membrane protease ATP23 n=1 Tax=Astrephomene gubernaculifera TaxID=47775 RepID=A0AAD3DWX7_9CHLO|nr:hypothetical protein Agub_g10547 [Astrephomene gubernaculifera]
MTQGKTNMNCFNTDDNSRQRDVGSDGRSDDAMREVKGDQCVASSAEDPGPLETLTRADVVDIVEYALATGRPVRTLMRAMDEAGCPVGRGFFHVLRCDAAVGGGFAPDHGVILCHNRLHTQREVTNAITHELIHAYDHCRYGGRGDAFPTATAAAAEGSTAGSTAAAAAGAAASGSGSGSGSSSSGDVGSASAAAAAAAGSSMGSSGCGIAAGGSSPERGGCEGGGGGSCEGGSSGCSGVGSTGGLDWSNCRHHACTEIRAANLSGDCSAWQELLRGNLPLAPTRWGEQQRACVARRAALSVAMNPACGGAEGAGEVVEQVMRGCLADTAPFDASEAAAAP